MQKLFHRRAQVRPVPVFMFERFAGLPQDNDNEKKVSISSKQSQKLIPPPKTNSTNMNWRRKKRKSSMRGDLYLESVAHLVDNNMANTKKEKKKEKKKHRNRKQKSKTSSTHYRPQSSTGSLYPEQDDGTLHCVLKIRSVSDSTHSASKNGHEPFPQMTPSFKLAKNLKPRQNLEMLLRTHRMKSSRQNTMNADGWLV